MKTILLIVIWISSLFFTLSFFDNNCLSIFDEGVVGGLSLLIPTIITYIIYKIINYFDNYKKNTKIQGEILSDLFTYRDFSQDDNYFYYLIRLKDSHEYKIYEDGRSFVIKVKK